MPKTTSPAKLKVVKQFGGSVVYYGIDCVEAEVKARNVAEVNFVFYVFSLIRSLISNSLHETNTTWKFRGLV